MTSKQVTVMCSTRIAGMLASGLIALSAGPLLITAQAASLHSRPLVAPMKPVTDTYYGVDVVDPYRYMENLKNPSVDAWFKQQNTYTRSVLDKISGREQLLADIAKYDNSVPAQVSDLSVRAPDLYFYEKLAHGKQVAKLYMQHGLSNAATMVFDPTRFERKGGPQWTIDYYSPSPDGRYLAVCVSPGGSEMAALHVINTQTGREVDRPISRTAFEKISWRRDGRSFYYRRLQKLPVGAPAAQAYEKSRVYLHMVGTDAAQDRAVFGYGTTENIAVRPIDFPDVYTLPDSPYALGILTHGSQLEKTIYAAPVNTLDRDHVPWKKIVGTEDEVTAFAVQADNIYLLTHRNAPRYKVVRLNLSHPDIAHAQTVVPEHDGVIIRGLAAASDALYVHTSAGMVSHLLRVPYDGAQAEDIALPYAGDMTLLSARATVPGVIFPMASWTHAMRLFAYQPSASRVIDTHIQPKGPYDRPGQLVSKEVLVRSYDGTQVPLSLVYKRGTKLDGTNPTLLMAYGAYGFTIPAELHGFVEPRPWYDRGGILAFAHVRGGGVFGEAWHKAGQKLTKPNTWRDFIACAHYLIDRNYTSSARLAVWSTSGGGITVGRAMTEQPKLFSVVIDESGASNPLRIGHMADGPVNYPEFGNTTTQGGFEDLYVMDSYHHVRDGAGYPAVLMTTGWNDPRIPAWMAGKMAARLQAASASGRPVLLRVTYNGGHGYGATRRQNEHLWADAFSFALWQFGEPGFQLRH